MKSLMVVILTIASTGLACGESQRHFFPVRPSGAQIRSDTGVLTSYGVGNDLGGFTIKRDGKTQTFYLGYPLTINRAIYRCLPTPERTHDEDECKRWPARLIVGKSRVRVTYWWGRLGAQPVKISDEITNLGS